MTVSYIMDNITTMRQVSPNIAEHLHTSNMISLGTWGTEVEIFALATILNATVYMYSQLGNSQKWLPCGPLIKSGKSIHSDESIFIQNLNHHYEPAML